jgi:hypothetical protein
MKTTNKYLVAVRLQSGGCFSETDFLGDTPQEAKKHALNHAENLNSELDEPCDFTGVKLSAKLLEKDIPYCVLCREWHNGTCERLGSW